MRIDARTPPPDVVAYVEDYRGRLWTGKGSGHWRCLTHRNLDPGLPWRPLWERHGPLVPLVPAGRLAVVAVAACLDRLEPDELPGEEPEGFRIARAVLDAAAYAPTWAGRPVPWAAGYVFGDCGHTLAAVEWTAGFLTCELCGHHTRRTRPERTR